MRAPVLVLLLLGLLASGCSGGGDGGREKRSESYLAAVDGWRVTALEPAATALRSATFSDLVVVERRESAKEAAAQTTRCRQIKAARSAVQALRPPTLEDGSEEAQRLSESVVASTRTWTDTVVPALGELVTYCDSYGRALVLSAQVAAAERALQAALSKPGVVGRRTQTVGTKITTTTFTCEDDRGCLPSDTALRTTYLAAYKRARITLMAEQYRLYGGLSVPCRLTDYARVCAVYAARLGTTVRFSTAFYEAVRTTSAFEDQAPIDRAAARADAESRRFTRQFDEAFALAFPEVDRSVPNADTRNQVRLLRGYEQQVAQAPLPVTALAP